MTDQIDRAIAGAAQPARRMQARIQLQPGPGGEERVVGIDLPLPFGPMDVLYVTAVLTDALSKQAPPTPADRLLIPRA